MQAMQSQTVKDLMVSREQYATVREDATLREAALALFDAQLQEREHNPARHRDRAVLVLDENDDVTGKLSMLDVLRGLEPRYDRVVGSRASSRAAARVGSARILIESMAKDVGLWKKPLSNLVEKAGMVTVGNFVRPFKNGETIDEHASMDTALHQLIMGHFQSLLVTRDGKIIGIIRLTDVYQKISEMLRANDPGADQERSDSN